MGKVYKKRGNPTLDAFIVAHIQPFVSARAPKHLNRYVLRHHTADLEEGARSHAQVDVLRVRPGEEGGRLWSIWRSQGGDCGEGRFGRRRGG